MTPEVQDVSAQVAPVVPIPPLIVQASGLMIEAHDEAHLVIVNTSSGRRARISRMAYELLCRFSTPATLEAGTSGDTADRMVRGVYALLERGLLVDAAKPEAHTVAARKAVPLRFCHAPAASPGQQPDIIVLGVPYDLGGDGNHRDAPALIRMKSQDYVYLVDFDSRLPRGWHDGNAGHRIMAGVSLCDAGDVPMHFGEEQSSFLDRVGEALAMLRGEDSFHVMLGGDAVSTYAAVRYTAMSTPVSVVRIAAPTSRAASYDDLVCIANLNHHLSRLPGVRTVLSLWSTAAQQPLPGGDIYLAIDLGAMDLSVPRKGAGLSIHEVDALVAAVAESGRLVGMNITGLDMDRPEAALGAVVACHVLIRAMHRAMLSRRRP